MRTRKRNNFTLSEEAQKIVDKIPNYKKSKFVSEAIVKNRPACDNPKVTGIYILDTPEKIEFANNLLKK